MRPILSGSLGLKEVASCMFLKESLAVQSCEFINLTAPPHVSLCLYSTAVKACAVTSAGAAQTHAGLLVWAIVVKFTLNPILGNILPCFSFSVVLEEDIFLSSRKLNHLYACAVNSPLAKALISATSLNNLH